MGVARSIEERLEGLVEGFFTRVFRSGVQPVEVGRRILREMGGGKTQSVNRVYAPNEFRIHLGPADHPRFEQMAAGLQREFSDLVIDQAKENRWNLMGLPRISFILDDALGQGEFRVDAALAADDEARQPRATTRTDDDAPDAARALPRDTAERLGVASGSAEVVVLEGDGREGETIKLARSPVVIGRLSACDVVLTDANVSRRHAELRSDGARWTVVDLGSTNGTLVNGKLAREHVLSDGDILTFGQTEMMFRNPR